MYGTVARMRAKPGTGTQLEALVAEYEALDIPGHVATYVYRLDGAADDYYLVAVFTDRESYRRNAEDPAQDARYRRLRELLELDPKWHDGEIIFASNG
jgi:quinol monooxygenase YgiN